MNEIKIKNIKTGVVKKVKKTIAGDFIGTKEWELVKEDTKKEQTNKSEYSK